MEKVEAFTIRYQLQWCLVYILLLQHCVFTINYGVYITDLVGVWGRGVGG